MKRITLTALLLISGVLGLSCGGDKMPEAKIPGLDTLTSEEKSLERALFPPENQVPDSHEFFEKEFMGVKALDYVYAAEYDIDGDRFQLFMTQDYSGAKYINLRAYAGAEYELKDAPAEIVFDDNYGFAFDHSECGNIIAGLRHNRLVGITGFESETAVSFFENWLVNLPEPILPEPEPPVDK